MWTLAFDKGRSKAPRNFRSSHFVKDLHCSLLPMPSVHFNTPIPHDWCLAPQSEIAAATLLLQNNEEAEGCSLNYPHYHAMGAHVRFLFIGLPNYIHCPFRPSTQQLMIHGQIPWFTTQ